MRIALASDAWTPQVNGVVRTLTTTVAMLRERGHAVLTITPDRFASLPCPSYPEIRLALPRPGQVAALLDGFAPDALHIATEGPLGWAARRWARRGGFAFSTSFHTRFPDYVAARLGFGAAAAWAVLRHFHAAAAQVLAATPRLETELHDRGLTRTRPWSRGVDLAQFSRAAAPDPELAALPRPLLLAVGRVAVEKNLAAFLALDRPGSKVVVGDGPALAGLAARFPDAVFTGARHGPALAAAYAAADVLVFPSRTDTFGLVMLEALACGTPVAGFPVAGPLDVIGADGSGVGALDADLGAAIERALRCRRDACAAFAARFGWERSVDQFVAGLAASGGVAHPHVHRQLGAALEA